MALVWRPQESSPWEEPMWSLLLETQRLHQKQGRPSWRRTQQHALMFWSLTSAPSSLSGLSRTSSTRWNFLWTSWCNPLHLLLCLFFFDIYEVCFALVKFISSLYAYSPILVLSSLHWMRNPFLFHRNNAGVMFCPFQLSKDGVEMQFATNHLGIPPLTTCLT